VDLAKLREIRRVFVQLAINVDKVIFRLCSHTEMPISKQLGILVHIFDGLDKHTKKQKASLNNLSKRVKSWTEASPLSAMIESLSKARILCMFYIKWLTIADNDYTDKEIAKADAKSKQEFGLKLTKNLDAISKAGFHALVDDINKRLDIIERKINMHDKTSRYNHNLILDQVTVVKETCILIAKQYPNETKEFIESRMEEIKELLYNIQKTLQSVDPKNAGYARNWRRKLEKGISTSADLVQLLTFITGIPSLPALFGSPLVIKSFELIRQLGQKLKK
jgi:hypothetical protein